MKRRQLLQYGALGVGSYIATMACQGQNLSEFPLLKEKTQPDFGQLEKTSLVLGFLPIVDSAPLIIAQEKGFFERYGLSVNLQKYPSLEAIENKLLQWQLDAAQASFSLPLIAQLREKASFLTALMVLNLNGSAVTLTAKAWEQGIRPLSAYTNIDEFSRNFRQYIRSLPKPAVFATDSLYSMENFLLRYLLSATGIDPNQDVEFVTIPPSQVFYKLQAGIIQGYCAPIPWNQPAVRQKAGFVICTSRDIWQGHPGSILATMDGWVNKHPNTTNALMASVLEACLFCDRRKNAEEIAQILAQSQYLNLSEAQIQSTLVGDYWLSQLGTESSPIIFPDLDIFHFKETPYLQVPNQANYPWLSQSVWLLTQAIRWDQIKARVYPKDAEKVLRKIYPVELYRKVADALAIEIPTEEMRSIPGDLFIDNRPFDPQKPLAYLNQFSIRT